MGKVESKTLSPRPPVKATYFQGGKIQIGAQTTTPLKHRVLLQTAKSLKDLSKRERSPKENTSRRIQIISGGGSPGNSSPTPKTHSNPTTPRSPSSPLPASTIPPLPPSSPSEPVTPKRTPATPPPRRAQPPAVEPAMTLQMLTDHLTQKGVQMGVTTKEHVYPSGTSRLLETLPLSAEEIAATPHLPPLIKLDLMNGHLTDAQFDALMKKGADTLIQLQMGFCDGITKESHKSLVQLKRLESLEMETSTTDADVTSLFDHWGETLKSLSLSYSQITDDALTTIGGMKQLSRLDLNGCEITSLVSLSSLPLSHLNVTSCFITQEQIAFFKRLCPRVTVTSNFDLTLGTPRLEPSPPKGLSDASMRSNLISDIHTLLDEKISTYPQPEELDINKLRQIWEEIKESLKVDPTNPNTAVINLTQAEDRMMDQFSEFFAEVDRDSSGKELIVPPSIDVRRLQGLWEQMCSNTEAIAAKASSSAMVVFDKNSAQKQRDRERTARGKGILLKGTSSITIEEMQQQFHRLDALTPQKSSVASSIETQMDSPQVEESLPPFMPPKKEFPYVHTFLKGQARTASSKNTLLHRVQVQLATEGRKIPEEFLTWETAELHYQKMEDQANLARMEPMFRKYYGAISEHIGKTHPHLQKEFDSLKNEIVAELQNWFRNHMELVAQIKEKIKEKRLDLMENDRSFRELMYDRVNTHQVDYQEQLAHCQSQFTVTFIDLRGDFNKTRSWIEKHPYLLMNFDSLPTNELGYLLAQSPPVVTGKITTFLETEHPNLLEEYNRLIKEGESAEEWEKWLINHDVALKYLRRITKNPLNLMGEDPVFRSFGYRQINLYLETLNPVRIKDTDFERNVRPWLESDPKILEPLDQLTDEDVLKILEQMPPLSGDLYGQIHEIISSNYPPLFSELEMIQAASLEKMFVWFQSHPSSLLEPIKKLSFAGIGLTSVPASFGQLTLLALEDLSLDDNRIAFLPTPFLPFSPNLVDFSIMSNRLEDLPKDMTRLWTNIVTIRFDYNQLRSMPEDLGVGCLALKVIQATHNRISYLPPHWVDEMIELKRKGKFRIPFLDFNYLKDQAAKEALQSFENSHIPVTSVGPILSTNTRI